MRQFENLKMKIQFIKYCLIVFVVASFTACNSFQKKENQNYTSLKFERLILNPDDYEKTLHNDLILDVEYDSAFVASTGLKDKLYLLQLSLSSNADDSILIFFSTSKELQTESVFSFDTLYRKWHFDGYNEQLMKRNNLSFHIQKRNSKDSYYKIIYAHQTQDSMMFRYYFKTSKFKDSLMHHDVYYTFKNDSFIIVRQTENEK
jgi:hypothetical protein